MVVGSRLQTVTPSGFKRLNLIGNKLFLATLNGTFRVSLTDILSGYRAFSRTFVKTVALVGGGFEVETELTIKAWKPACGSPKSRWPSASARKEAARRSARSTTACGFSAPSSPVPRLQAADFLRRTGIALVT